MFYSSDLEWFLNSELLLKIDVENESEIRNRQNDWIPVNKTKEICREIVKRHLQEASEDAEKTIEAKLLNIFDLAIEDDSQAVCFIFQ